MQKPKKEPKITRITNVHLLNCLFHKLKKTKKSDIYSKCKNLFKETIFIDKIYVLNNVIKIAYVFFLGAVRAIDNSFADKSFLANKLQSYTIFDFKNKLDSCLLTLDDPKYKKHKTVIDNLKLINISLFALTELYVLYLQHSERLTKKLEREMADQIENVVKNTSFNLTDYMALLCSSLSAVPKKTDKQMVLN